ncbi:MAG: hypothetical protein IPK13_10225 [Deltaproteobacteria bacterium]|nr:hypothetical protein [Deltaproteobacteria bacterium]
MHRLRRDQPKVELFRQAKLIDSFMPPAGQEIWSVAVSGSGALAAATARGDASYLHLVRGETRLLFELPEPLTALEWVGPNAQ